MSPVREVDRGPRGLGSRYWRLWGAATVSNLGDGARLAALPLLAAALTREPTAVAGVAAAQRLPWLLFALVGGALADRFDRRRLMILTHGFRMVVEAIVGLAVLTGQAGLPLLYGAAFALGCAETIFDNAAQAMIPALVRAGDLERANGRLYAGEVVTTSFVGPSSGGLLFSLAPSLPFLLDAGSFGAGAAVIATIRGSFAPRPEERRSFRQEIGAGLRWLWSDPVLRRLGGLVALLGLFSMTAWSVLVLYALEILHVTRGGYGVLLTVASLGSLAGAVLAPVARARLTLPTVLFASVWVSGLSFIVVGVTSSPWLAGVALAANGCTVVMWNVVTVSLRQTLTPGALLGRVSATYRLLAWGSMPLGAMVGGALATQWGLRAPFLVAGFGLLSMAALTLRVATDRDELDRWHRR